MPCLFKMRCNDIDSNDVRFLRDLYYIMEKYNIHRIYNASLDKKKIVVAQQLLSATIGNSNSSKKIFAFLDKYIPSVYFGIFFKNHIFRYKLRLKKLFNEYGVEKIGATSFQLQQGIYITDNSLCIRDIDLIFKDGRIFHIDGLYLDI